MLRKPANAALDSTVPCLCLLQKPFVSEGYIELGRGEAFPEDLQLLLTPVNSNCCGPWWSTYLAPGFVPLPALFLHLPKWKQQVPSFLSAHVLDCRGKRFSSSPRGTASGGSPPSSLCSYLTLHCVAACSFSRRGGTLSQWLSTLLREETAEERPAVLSSLHCSSGGNRRHDWNTGVPLPKGVSSREKCLSSVQLIFINLIENKCSNRKNCKWAFFPTLP